MAGSESVFSIIQFGPQSGTAYAPGSPVPATNLFPIESPIPFDLNRAAAYPKQDRGRNVMNFRGQGYYGVKEADATLPSQVSFEDIMDILEMCYSGGVTPTESPTGVFTWVYPFEALTPTLIPRTIEGGNTDNANAQMRMASCLVDQLTMGFPQIVAPGAFPWTISAKIMGLDRTISPLTTAGSGTDEVQSITISGATGGTWVASFEGANTAPLAYDISTADLTTALEGLATIGSGNVAVTGTPGAYVVTFGAGLADLYLPPIVAYAYGLTGAGTPTIAVLITTPGAPPALSVTARRLEIVQGHLTQMFEGDTSTAYGSLPELAGSLKAFTLTASRNFALRAYGNDAAGSTPDMATRFGFKDKSNGTFEALVGVSATSKSDFHDIWDVTDPAPLGERRWRLLAKGTVIPTTAVRKQFIVDARVGIFAVPTDESDGERVFKVTGEFVDDDVLAASHQVTVVNGVAGPL
jgi:hypothetical protein